jgi:hypothetical protein
VVTANGRSLYFAYGSNLLSRRMTSRVPSASAICVARVDGFRICVGKPGRDGSGKATLIASDGSRAWGVVYEIDPLHWARLDACEQGYNRVQLLVTHSQAEQLLAQTYLAPETAADPVAFSWYKRFLVDGAREHRLPATYVAELERLPERPDPRGVNPGTSQASEQRP